MKYLLLLALLIPNLLVAQPLTIQKPVTCVDTKMLLQGLLNSDYKEKPIWSGTQSDATLSQYSVFINEETKSWTLIQFNNQLACVLGTGTESTRIFNGPKI